MANWYDGIVEKYDQISDGVGDLVGEYIGAEKDRVTEQIRNPVTEEVNREPTTQTKSAVMPAFNWQMAGVVVGGLGVLLTVYKLVK